MTTRNWFAVLYAGLAIVFVVVLTRLRFPGFPDIPFSLFAAMSFECPYPFLLVLGIFLGLLTEGLYPAEPWVTPLMYVLLASASRYARNQMNLQGWPLVVYFLLWGMAFKLIPPLFHNQGFGLFDAACGSVLSGVLAYLLYLPWKKEE